MIIIKHLLLQMFHNCGIFMKACFKNGRFVDCHCYELLKL